MSFLRVLAENPTLPRGLERLCFTFHYHPVPSDRLLPELMIMGDALLVRCPNLQLLWLNAGVVLLRWRKWPDGSVEERTTDNAGESCPPPFVSVH